MSTIILVTYQPQKATYQTSFSKMAITILASYDPPARHCAAICQPNFSHTTPHLSDIIAICHPHDIHIPVTCYPHVSHYSAIARTHVISMLARCKPCVSHMSAGCKKQCQPHVNNNFQPHSSHIPAP
jgi:hypothetical protein